MKKGRHRRFEEARKLKQMGPDFLFSEPVPAPAATPAPKNDAAEEDELAEIAARYGAFDDEDDDDPDDAERR